METQAPPTTPPTGICTTDITWETSARARREARELDLSNERYEETKRALQDLLCAYFNGGACTSKLGKTISPLASGIAGCKLLKVRWLRPGEGKRGGFRLAVGVWCDERRVRIGGLFQRKTEPTDDELRAALREN